MFKHIPITVILLWPALLMAQTPPHFAHVPANAGTNNLYFNNSVCSKFQFIYTQAEIAAMNAPVTEAITIDTLWFRHGGGGNPSIQLNNFVVRMGHTSLVNPGAQFNSNFNVGAPQTVLSSASYTYTPLIGATGVPDDNWTFIPLQTPFTYNYTDNLCVEFSYASANGFIAGNFANNGGAPVTQYALSSTATTADASTSRPMFGLSRQGGLNCDPNGNWLLFSNYDGGNLNIIVDQDIPNLHIGVCSYEDCAINVSGPFAQNVVQVRYAGYQGNNLHCNNQITITSITAPAGVVTDVTFLPASVLADPDGNPNIVCAYSCNPGDQGGCNTVEQVAAYYQAQFGGALRGLAIQYCCWDASTPYRVSEVSGNCCSSQGNGAATVSYPAGPFCPDDGIISPVLTGDNSGTFYSVPDGLTIDAATGAVDLSTSTPGDYQIVYANQVNCNEILINNAFTLNTGISFNYPLAVYAISETAEQTPVLSGTIDGSFTSTPAGLSINAATGAINPSLSQAGVYTVTYSPNTSSSCGNITTTVEILSGGDPFSCDPNGNWFLISNYDGGNLSIIVDQDIPDLKIGICTYEPVNVSFSGAFVANIAEVRYAGFNSNQNNNNCGFPISASAFSGIDAGLVTLEVSPPVNIISPPNPNNILDLPNGYNFGVICLASCDINAYQGGCNTADQVVDYFQTQFGGSLRGAAVQYCCWRNETPYRVSQLSGNCCANPDGGAATVTYPAGPFCAGDGEVSPTLTGDNSGTFYSVPAGLTIDAATGVVDLSSSTAGEYQIVYARQINCNEVLISNNFTLNSGTSQPPAFALPNPICVASGELEPEQLTGFAPGGTFSALPEGLSIDATDGTINPVNSQPGQYNITYTIEASQCGTAQTFTFPNLIIEAEQEPYPLVLGDTCLSGPLSVALGGTAGVLSVQWNMGDPLGGASNTANTAAHSHQYTQAGTFTITAFVEYGCGSDTITRVIQTVEEINPQLAFAYPLDPCRMSSAAPVTAAGFATGGVFTVEPTLPINSANGTLGVLGNTEGDFIVTYTFSGGNCIAAGSFSDTISVAAFSESLSANPESVQLVLGDTVELGASGTLTYTWSPTDGLSCSNCTSPLAFPTETTQYIVAGIDANGCRSLDTVLVIVDIICNEVFIPTIFSPNGKGPQANETFCAFSDCVDQFKLVIHNRWGEKVFETEDINQCWDGTFKGVEAANGVYAFNLYIKQLDGKVLSKTGSVSLIK